MNSSILEKLKRISNNYTLLVVITILALFNVILHIVVSYNLEYQRDELLYFTLGIHPGFGYATVPPLIGWIAWLMQNIFGYSLFAVRIFPAVMSGVMVILISAIARELGGSVYSRILAAIGIIISGIGLRTFLLYQPVHIDLVLWTLSFYIVIRYINTKAEKYLILFGVIAGIALLNKYLIGLLFISFLLVIPFTKYRDIFRKGKFWTGILVGTIIFLPNFIWQIVHGLPVIDHLSDLARFQLVNVKKTAFLADQLFNPMAASVLTVAGIIYLFIDKNVKKFRFLGVISLLIILIIMFLQGKSYYTIGIFPLLIAAGAVCWERLLKKLWSRVLLIAILIIITLPLAPNGIPVYKQDKLISYYKNLGNKYGITFICRFEDGSIHSLPQDYADMLGWEELAKITNEAWTLIPDKKSAFIYCENYGQAGAITIIGRLYDLPEAVSFNESFKYWFPRKFDPDIKYMVYINYNLGEDVQELFRKITVVGSITNPDAREYGTKVYLCEDPVMSFNSFWISRTSGMLQEN